MAENISFWSGPAQRRFVSACYGKSQYSDHPFLWRTDGGPRDDFERAAPLHLRWSEAQGTVHEFAEIVEF